MTKLKEAALVEGDQARADELQNALGRTSAAELLAAAKDPLPGWLKRGGVNPLELLYGALSTKLHDSDEEAALREALRIRDTFEMVMQSVWAHIAQVKRFTATVVATVSGEDA